MRFSAVWVALCAAAIPASAQGWPMLAGNAARTGIAPQAPPTLEHVLWHAAPLADEEFVAASPVACAGRVFISARRFEDFIHVENRVIAFDAWSGQRLWSAPAEPDWLDSTSAPAVDTANDVVIYASGREVVALRAADGTGVWARSLDRIVVNASPLVTADLVVSGRTANRVLITDFSGAGTGAKLYAINVDPFDAVENPFNPGDVAWSVPIDGGSGNSPAYAAGVVFVSASRGTVAAFDARSGTPRWSNDLIAGTPGDEGFFGGLTVRNGAVFAATYGFYGGQNNSSLYKLDAASGAKIWEIPCDRTDSIPIVTDDGRIFLSSGIDGYGSAVKVQAFRDLGATAALLWDTHAATGGALEVGGWSTQPLLNANRLFVGRPAAPAAPGLYDSLLLLDLARGPAAPGFVIDEFAGAGGSCAALGSVLYSVGVDGLFAFAPGTFEPALEVDTIHGHQHAQGRNPAGRAPPARYAE